MENAEALKDKSHHYTARMMARGGLGGWGVSQSAA
jgi:hypothetical protein